MKVSIITVVFNGADTIESAIQSVLSQDYKDVEYIIIDGNSTDHTLKIIEKYKSNIQHIVSEKDDGIYFAMNKGLKLASGDIIGILNSDDFYMHNGVISKVAETISGSQYDGVYSDLVYVDKNEPSKIIRYWQAGIYSRNKFKWGWMPPHPTVFLRRSVYEKFGLFNTSLTSAADYELLLRLMYRYKVKLKYIPEVLIKMRVGGKSNVTLKNRAKANIEDLQAWKINGLNPYIFTTYLKPIIKLKQYWQRPVRG